MNKTVALLLMIPLSGCISIGHHTRKICEVRQSDYEYAVKLAREVQVGELRPQDMVSRLKWRFRIQEELP